MQTLFESDLPGHNKIRIAARSRLSRAEYQRLLPAIELALVDDSGPTAADPPRSDLAAPFSGHQDAAAILGRRMSEPQRVGNVIIPPPEVGGADLGSLATVTKEEVPQGEPGRDWFFAYVNRRWRPVTYDSAVGKLIKVRETAPPRMFHEIDLEHVIEPHRAMVRLLAESDPGSKEQLVFESELNHGVKQNGQASEKSPPGQTP